jgi:ABC-2 type transport system ATP-binding protein
LSIVADIRQLTVQYGRKATFKALDDFSCRIDEGATGLLGPNGAGKTTLIKTLLGFVQPQSGTGDVLGHNIATDGRWIRQKVGYMPEQDCHIPGMTAVQFVAYAGELAGMPHQQAIRRSHEVLEYCGLGEARYRNVETYSTGMKQRIKLAQALVHGPKVLLLDEPTNGLDPAGREDMLELIRSVSHGKGLNVIVSSHLLKDVERVCDRVVVVMRGKLAASGSIRDLKAIQGQPVDVEVRESSPAFAAELEKAGATVHMERERLYRVQTGLKYDETHRLVLAAARASGAQVRGFGLAERSLEEVFLEAVQ